MEVTRVAEADLRQRLAAILAADAAGYSRLMSADERATVAALDAARGVLKRIGNSFASVSRTMRGCGLFGLGEQSIAP
jgi:class 3 adenylate cyclase